MAKSEKGHGNGVIAVIFLQVMLLYVMADFLLSLP